METCTKMYQVFTSHQENVYKLHQTAIPSHHQNFPAKTMWAELLKSQVLSRFPFDLSLQLTFRAKVCKWSVNLHLVVWPWRTSRKMKGLIWLRFGSKPIFQRTNKDWHWCFGLGLGCRRHLVRSRRGSDSRPGTSISGVARWGWAEGNVQCHASKDPKQRPVP